MYYHEEQMDLLKAPRGYAIAHCISADFALGAGVARQIQAAYDLRSRLRKLCWNTEPAEMVGRCIVSMDVMNLVTKQRYYEKPTLESLEAALRDMACVVQALGIWKIAMPRIGCGLDKLNWNDVSAMIQSVFGEMDDVEIMVCVL